MTTQNNSQDRKKDISTIIKENWFIIFFIVSFLLVLISLLVQRLLPDPVPIQDNTWNGVTPGHSKYSQMVEIMGTPIDSVETEDGYEIKYQSDFLAIPNEVVTDKEGTVQFIKEKLIYDESHTLSQYVDQFGEPDLVLQDESGGISLRANVFLEEGLVIMAHIKDGSVEGKWYFVPSTKAEFLSSWGENLSSEARGAHGPEKPF